MKERSKHFQYLSLTHNPSLKDHKLEHAEDLKSWIIIYLKLELEARLTVQRCWQACAWPGNKPLVLEGLLEFSESMNQDALSPPSLQDLTLRFLFSVFVASVNQKWHHVYKTNTDKVSSSEQITQLYLFHLGPICHSFFHLYKLPFKQFRLQKHSCPQVCSERINPKDRAQCFILSNGSRNRPSA